MIGSLKPAPLLPPAWRRDISENKKRGRWDANLGFLVIFVVVYILVMIYFVEIPLSHVVQIVMPTSIYLGQYYFLRVVLQIED